MAIFNKRDVFICLFFFSITFFSRIYLVEKYQSHWDGPQYSIAIFKYSFSQQTPAPPGYPLYIGMGKIFNYLISNPHYSLLFESALFTSIGTSLMYLFGKELGGRRAGLIASVIYFSSPVIYYFGLTAYAYGIDAVFYLIFAYLGYGILNKKKWGLLTGISYSLLIAFRPQDLIFSWPLALLVFLDAKKGQKISLLSSFFLTTLLWTIPYLNEIGGIKQFNKQVSPLSNARIPALDFLYPIKNFQILLKGIILTMGISVFFPIMLAVVHFPKIMKGKSVRWSYSRKNMFFVVWIIPPFFFNLFIRSDHAGYQLSYLIPVMILCAYACSLIIRRNQLLALIIIAIIFSNFYLFFRNRDPEMKFPYVPTSFHYSEIKKNDIKMSAKIDWITANINPKNSIIIIGVADYFRPVMYHLPQYRVINLAALTTENKTYRNIVREGHNFNMSESQNEHNIYILPKKTNNIICFDDECSSWLKGIHYRRITLAGNSSLSVFNSAKIRYSFHTITE